jgi:hypothetical protein
MRMMKSPFPLGADNTRSAKAASGGGYCGVLTGLAAYCVWARTTLGEDAPDGVRALRRRAPEEAWQRKTGDLQLFGFHSHVRDKPEGGQLCGPAKDHRQTHGSQAERHQSEATPAQARVHNGHAEVGLRRASARLRTTVSSRSARPCAASATSQTTPSSKVAVGSDAKAGASHEIPPACAPAASPSSKS